MIVIISFFLENILSNVLPYQNSIFSLLLVVSTIPILYFIIRGRNYPKFCLLIGILYDLFMTNTLFINAIIFYLLAHLIKYINKKLTVNIFTNTIIIFITLILYQVYTYIMLILLGYLRYNMDIIYLGIKNVLIINILYETTLFILLFKIKKYRNKYMKKYSII